MPLEFNRFDLSHIFVLILTFVGVLLCFLLKNKSLKIYGLICLSILVITTIVFNVYHITRGTFVIERYLPFHLCNISVYLILLAFIVKKQATQIVLYLSPASAFLAILLPDMGRSDGFPTFRFMEFFISHMLIVILCIWFIADNRFNLKYKYLWLACGVLFIWMVLMKFVNNYIGSNYLYVNDKPSNAKAIFDLFGPDNNYIFGLCIAVLIIFHLEYLFFKALKYLKIKFF